MRYIFAEQFQKIADSDKKTVFMTGDLGFNAFEPLIQSMGPRFINAGVAEHNMVTAAAGLAYSGLKPWIYSIAPFVSIKVLEELRNDVCLPNANVKIVALGGGFDYAIAGPTHHALEDVALMLTLPNMKIYVPSFPQDIAPIIKEMSEHQSPSYLRLTKAHTTNINIPAFKPMRQVIKGDKLTIVVLGSLAVEVIDAVSKFEYKIDLWAVSQLPLRIDDAFEESIKKTKSLIIIEEHVEHGGLGQYLSAYLMKRGRVSPNFIHLATKGYQSGLYGSRDFYLKENSLDKKSIARIVEKYLSRL